jgi:hypothetical protein
MRLAIRILSSRTEGRNSLESNSVRLDRSVGRGSSRIVAIPQIRRVALGEQHPYYAASLNTLAMLYHAMGRHAEAERLVREGLGS